MKTEKNLQLTKLIAELKKASAKNNSAIWKAIALELEKPTRRRRSVNVYKIDKYSKENETVIVPGKVLGVGDLSKKVNVAAFTFSQEAMQKINQKGQALSIEQLMTKHPDGKNIRILG
ncbi:MAG: 50S ribosomal protein L18e [Nanoarchaeota archaeon]|nr:50S ribosomal protein L18e [Nanoarchaeota archaeon]